MLTVFVSFFERCARVCCSSACFPKSVLRLLWATAVKCLLYHDNSYYAYTPFPRCAFAESASAPSLPDHQTARPGHGRNDLLQPIYCYYYYILFRARVMFYRREDKRHVAFASARCFGFDFFFFFVCVYWPLGWHITIDVHYNTVSVVSHIRSVVNSSRMRPRGFVSFDKPTNTFAYYRVRYIYQCVSDDDTVSWILHPAAARGVPENVVNLDGKCSFRDKLCTTSCTNSLA